MARLEGRELEAEMNPPCGLIQSFISTGFVFVGQINAIDDSPSSVKLIYHCSPATELNNWEAIEFSVMFETFSM